LFTVMQLHRKLIWYVHFLTSCNHVCERSVPWKVLENAFLSPGKPWNHLVFASPGNQCFNVCTNPDLGLSGSYGLAVNRLITALAI